MTKEEAIEMLKHCAVEYHCKDHYWGRHMCEKCNQRIAQDMAIESLKTEAIPVEFIKELHKEAIEYRDHLDSFWQAPAWNRADNQAIGINSVLQMWEDRHG